MGAQTGPGPTRRAVPEARVLRAPSAPRLASPLWKQQTFARRSQRPRSPFGDPAWRGALTSEQSMGSRWTRAETRGICGRAAALCTPSERSAVFLLFLFFSEWLRADAHGAAGCAPSLAYTVRVLVGAEQTLREPQWVPQSVKRVHGRPPPASLQASAVWPDLAGPLPEVMLFRGAGRTPCTRRGVRQGARGPPPAARATLPGEERGVTGQPQSGCTRPARGPEPRFPRRPPAPPRRWSAVWALLSLPTPGRFLSRVSWAIRAAGGLVQGFERCARVQAP